MGIGNPPLDRRPWKRFFAKTIDLVLYGLLIEIVVVLLGLSLPGIWQQVAVSFLTCLLLLLLEPLLLSKFGSTPGKFLFHLHLSAGAAGAPPDLKVAYKRTFEMWLKGLFAGIPYLSIATQLFFYEDLKAKGATPWDLRNGITFSYSQMGRFRIALAWILVLGVYALRIAGMY